MAQVSPTEVVGNSFVSSIGTEGAPPKEDIETPNKSEREEPSLQPRVRISETTEAVVAEAPTIHEVPPRRSILQNTKGGVNYEQVNDTSEPQDNNDPRNDASHVKEVHYHKNMLFKEYSNDGMKETCYHVSGFAGLYPVWPIIEFSMAPTGEAKDNRMNSFIKCVAALFGKILHINDTAKIPTILITEDETSYILSKADLPTNFTKLGQYIMISGGSWVFNKRPKGVMMCMQDSDSSHKLTQQSS